MSLFLTLSILMALAAALFVALPLLLRKQETSGPAQQAANIAIHADQIAELENDLKNGVLSQEQVDLARHELDRRLLQDTNAAPATFAPGARWPTLLAAVLTPLLAAGVYFMIGTPAAIDAPAPLAADPRMQQVQAMLPKLEQHLQTSPNDANAWRMLGKAYLVLDRFAESANAYNRLTQLTPNDAQGYADFADALAMAQGQSFAGKPRELLATALKLDPSHGKANYLAGYAAMEAGKPQDAVRHWENLLKLLAPESQDAAALRAQIAELKQQTGGMQAAPSNSPAPSGSTGTAQVSGKVRLAASMKQQAHPDDTLFVYARAVEGPKMPLAMLRVQVKDLPVDFTLDDSMAMSPQMKLSNFPQVVIVARVTKSGAAVPQAGDLEGVSAPVKLGAKDVAVEISKKVQ